MIFFLYGNDTYRSKEKLDEIVNHYKQIYKSGLNLKFFENEELDIEILKATLKQI